MSGIVIIGAAYGDEGKGRMVDVYAEDADMVVRYAGGCNAGHTLVVNNKKTILRLIPSGVLRQHIKCVLGAGMVIDMGVLTEEVKALEEAGYSVKDRLFISDRAHIIKEKHIEADKNHELGPKKLGTTKKGIGPCYEDKVARRGMRVGDLSNEALKNAGLLANVCDTSFVVNNALDFKQTVIFEGAQGTMLDIDHGTYPYVTSSNAVAGGACTGVGVGPTRIDSVVGITKAYLTRVGEGPMPTELHGEAAETLRELGGEYGSVTGRPRRVGWLDLAQLKYAAMVNGMTELVVTKLDVLSGIGDITVGVFHTADGRPGYRTMPGWSEEICKASCRDDLPKEALDYLKLIEDTVGVPIAKVSVGPDRSQIVNFR